MRILNTASASFLLAAATKSGGVLIPRVATVAPPSRRLSGGRYFGSNTPN